MLDKELFYSLCEKYEVKLRAEKDDTEGEFKMTIEQVNGDGYSQEELIRQAGCFRLLAYRTEQAHLRHEQLPDFMKKIDDIDGDISFITRTILAENRECLNEGEAKEKPQQDHFEKNNWEGSAVKIGDVVKVSRKPGNTTEIGIIERLSPNGEIEIKISDDRVLCGTRRKLNTEKAEHNEGR